MLDYGVCVPSKGATKHHSARGETTKSEDKSQNVTMEWNHIQLDPHFPFIFQ